MQTKNYNQFKLAKANRITSESHVNKIVNSIKKYGYFKSKPITITRDYVITDGQHRFLACKSLNIPVIYEIDNIAENEGMIVLNTTANTWRLQEYINHFAKKGNADYAELLEFHNQNPGLGITNCIAIFSGSFSSMSSVVKKGSKLKRFNKFNDAYELVMFFKGKVPFYRTAYFIRGIVAFIKDQTTEKKHIERLKINAFGLTQCATTMQYVAMFNKISKKKINTIV